MIPFFLSVLYCHIDFTENVSVVWCYLFSYVSICFGYMQYYSLTRTRKIHLPGVQTLWPYDEEYSLIQYIHVKKITSNNHINIVHTAQCVHT